MPHIHIETFIEAPIGRVFDLMRDVETHLRSTLGTNERVVTGKQSGLLEQGDEVTWEATHFRVRQQLRVRIIQCDPPYVFEDQMVRGAFKSFTHRHSFREDGEGTLMVDDFDYTSPLGWLGVLADRLFLTTYMRGFLMRRAVALKETAECLTKKQAILPDIGS
jgi:ligand-binding SRPBCC domain-containing protein